LSAAYPQAVQCGFPSHRKCLLHTDPHLWITPRPPGISARSIPVLAHGGAAGRAEIALLTHKAGGDGADIGDLAGAKPIDIRRTSPSLLRRAKCKSRAGGDKRQCDPERGGDTFRDRKSSKL